MSGWVFPVLGAVALYGVVAPAASLLVLGWFRWRRGVSVEAAGDVSRSWLLLAPVALPVLWSLSAVAHLQEGDVALPACLHDRQGRCLDVWGFGAAVLLPWLLGVVRVLRRGRPGAARQVVAPDLVRRLARLRGHAPALARLDVRWVEGEAPAAAVRGVLVPFVQLHVDFARSLDDEALLAVLLHEAEHAQRRDVLRRVAVEAALWPNPMRRWLRPEWRRWLAVREIACDEAACRQGASPAALAAGIVKAVRYESGRLDEVAALAGAEGDVVRLRVALLLAMEGGFAGCGVRGAVREPVASLGSSCLAVALMPHVAGTAFLDGFHRFVEVGLHLLGAY